MSEGSKFNPAVVDEAMKRLDLTDTQVGAAIGVSSSTVGNYRRGVSEPSATRLLALAETLGLDVSALFTEGA